MKFSLGVFLATGVVLLCVGLFSRPLLPNAQGQPRQQTSDVLAIRRSPSPTRKPTQTRVPTRKPSHTRVITKTKTRSPSHTRVVVKTHTKTRIPPTHTRMPTTTPSTVPSATPTPAAVLPTDTIEFVNVGASDWRVLVNAVSIGVEPTLGLQNGETYTFTVNAGSFHPLLLSIDGTRANEYTDGVSPTGGSTTTVSFVVPASAPSLLYYVCANHPSMRGQLIIVAP